jgi:hypothetical protein
MKKICLFLIFSFFSGKVFAESETTTGILKQLIGESDEEVLKQDSSDFKPYFAGKLVLAANFDDQYQSNNRQDEFTSSYNRNRFYSSFNFARHFALNSFLKMAPSNQLSQAAARNVSNDEMKSNLFEKEALLIEELNLSYDGKKNVFVIGKFDLNFGSAWRWTRGIWSYDIALDYKQREKLGFNGIYRVGNSKKTGRYQFGYAVFTNDRKNLDNSIITSRYSDQKSDAVPGDTRGPQSYMASIDIDFDFTDQEKLSYHFSYVNLAVNQRASTVSKTKIADQEGFAAGMNYKYPVTKNFNLDGLLEYVRIKNYNGDSDIGENYLTANIIAKFYQTWNVTLGYAERKNSHIDEAGFNQNLSEISFGYEFKKTTFFDKLLLQIGYKNQRDNYKTSLEKRNVLGAMIRYEKSF